MSGSRRDLSAVWSRLHDACMREAQCGFSAYPKWTRERVPSFHGSPSQERSFRLSQTDSIISPECNTTHCRQHCQPRVRPKFSCSPVSKLTVAAERDSKRPPQQEEEEEETAATCSACLVAPGAVLSALLIAACAGYVS